MPRAWQTPHGARPNREGVRFGAQASAGRVPARCAKPSGRSLEPRSNARPRGMAVLLEKSGGQNSAYRSSCQQSKLYECFSPQRKSSVPRAIRAELVRNLFLNAAPRPSIPQSTGMRILALRKWARKQNSLTTVTFRIPASLSQRPLCVEEGECCQITASSLGST